ncbi:MULTISPECIES: hypothetical protein [unclassified Fibrobacter]|uniref:hypothetical protein n=1 Tax=unclassified Fibrobacter TaxID=2634177 RepID=UPI000D6B8ABB|nr:MULTISPECIES: hypothetical protein [unclassified Fibrobacter]PWJ68296.1 hypothetical protein BGX12_10821 [Fibrobacter sp. UWR4]PZW65630.1 hypothetical protein C8E88_103021 [Fibrobacter sp. UWR1]
MMKETLFNLIRKGNYNISIYTEEIFERRCQEEIIRSDEDSSSFVYIELDFEAIKNAMGSDEDNLKFWSIFMASLHKSSRGSDIIGFLENQTGLGMLLLDSNVEGWERVRGRILQMAKTEGFDKVDDFLKNSIKPILYPACIQNVGLANLNQPAP